MTVEEIGALYRGRMGEGEYDLPGAPWADRAVVVGLRLFSAAVDQQAPQVRRELFTGVFPLYVEVEAARGCLGDTPDTDWLFEVYECSLGWADAPLRVPADVWASFRRALFDWAERFRLNYGWFLCSAIVDLEVSRRSGEGGRSFFDNFDAIQCARHASQFPALAGGTHWFTLLDRGVLNHAVYGAPGPLERPRVRCLVLELEGWDPANCRWDVYEAGVRKAFDRSLAEYQGSVRRAVETKGYRRTRRKVNPEHFRMLVDWIVYRKAYWEIAKSYDLSEKAVQSGMHAAARQIGMRWPRGPCGKRAKRPAV
jgi:hypothetical protein